MLIFISIILNSSLLKTCKYLRRFVTLVKILICLIILDNAELIIIPLRQFNPGFLLVFEVYLCVLICAVKSERPLDRTKTFRLAAHVPGTIDVEDKRMPARPAAMDTVDPPPPEVVNTTPGPTNASHHPMSSSGDDTADESSPWVGVRSKKRKKTSGGESGSDDSVKTIAAAPNATPNHKPSIPPIVIAGYRNWQQLLKSLAVDYEAKFVGQLLHVKVATISHFRELQKLLRSKGVAFHTFTPPVERELKVTIRGLPSDTPPEDIRGELSKLGVTVGQVTPLMRTERGEHPRKLPSNTFLVRVKREGRWEKVWEVKRLLGVTILIDKFNPPRGMAQCYNCQRFGHSSENCNLPPRCVKCAGTHLGRECQKRQDMEAPLCCNCGGSHPASWRGCVAHKDALAAQRRRKTAPPPPVAGSRQRHSGPARTAPTPMNGRSYAAAAAGQGSAAARPPVVNPTAVPAPDATTNTAPTIAAPNAAPSATPGAATVTPPALRPPQAPVTMSTEANHPPPQQPGPSNPAKVRRRRRQGRSTAARRMQRPHHNCQDSEYDEAMTSQTEDERAPRRKLVRESLPPRQQQCGQAHGSQLPPTPTAAIDDTPDTPALQPSAQPMDCQPHRLEATPHPISPVAVVQWLASIIPLLLTPGSLSPDQLVTKLVQSLTQLIHHGKTT